MGVCKRESMKLGLCQDGKQYCDSSLVSQLQAMGFNRSQSIEALKMANNVISEAISIIQDTPHLLQSSETEDLIAKVRSADVYLTLVYHPLKLIIIFLMKINHMPTIKFSFQC